MQPITLIKQQLRQFFPNVRVTPVPDEPGLVHLGDDKHSNRYDTITLMLIIPNLEPQDDFWNRTIDAQV